MPKHEIVPAHDERFQCEFVIPRKGKAPLEFSVPKVKYLPEPITEAFQQWAEDYEDEATGSKIPADRDTYLKLFELTLSASKFEQVSRLTIGELEQVWKIWTTDTDIDMGESSASDAS